MIFFVCLMILCVSFLLFAIHTDLQDINDNLLDLEQDLCRCFIINSVKKRGKK